jgi:hypothetical protein
VLITRRFLYVCVFGAIAALPLSSCGAPHSSLPAAGVATGGSIEPDSKRRLAPHSASTDLVAINAGGGAAGGFAADEYYGSQTSWTHAVQTPIDTSLIPSPAPQAVYQTQRTGPKLIYTIPGLTAGTTYVVTLSFAELTQTGPGQRLMNVSLNGAAVLNSFDIFASAGAADRAIAETFNVAASSAGTIAIELDHVTSPTAKANAIVNAIEIAPFGASPAPSPSPSPVPTPTPPTTDVVAINAGGGATGSFAADEYYGSQTSWTHTVQTPIDTSLIPSPAPQAVYQTQRTGPKLIYTIPGLTAGTNYAIKLSFAELTQTGPGQRLMNVSLNGTPVLTSFDIFAAAGATDRAVAETFNVAADSTGSIAIELDHVTTATAKANAVVNAIEIASYGASPSPSPSASATAAFVDWPSYGFDVARTGYNPNTTNLTPASISQLHVGWQLALNNDVRTQPVVITGISGHAAVLIVGVYNNVEAYDALTGTLIWTTALPLQDVGSACSGGSIGVSGTVAYDAALGSIFVAAGDGNPRPNHVVLYRLAAATGTLSGQVDVTPTLLNGESNHGTSGITFANGQIYLGTASDCEGGANFPMWRGRVVSVNPVTMSLNNTFFPTWGQGGNYGGGGIWSWGGVSSDPSGNIYAATGNTQTATILGTTPVPSPFVLATNTYSSYGEHLVKLDPNLNFESANYPGFDVTGQGDLDYAGTPVIFQPPGCGLLVATQGKGGTLVVNNASDASEVNSFPFSVRTSRALYIGNPGYSPATGYLYAAITSDQPGTSLLPPGLAAISGCGTSIAWNSQFGPDSEMLAGSTPRSMPTVTAGGVVFMATPCVANGNGGCAASGSPVGGALWAVDATVGTVLNGGEPLLITASQLRMAPSADGDWLFLIDDGGNFYGLTIDSTIPAIRPKAGRRVVPRYVYKGD